MKKLLTLILLSISCSSFANSHIDFTLSDFCYLQPNVQDRDGVYFFPNQEVGITASSLCVWKGVYGQYHSKGKLLNGKKEGKWNDWNILGEKVFESDYKNGELVKEIHSDRLGWEESIYSNGVRIESIRFNKDGQIRNESKYEDGELSYRTFYTYHKNGKLRMKGNEIWPEIDFDGTITSWYKNGQKEHESSYSKGELVGKNTRWYENGQLSGEYFYGVDDFINRYWYKNGQLLGEYTNENGISTSMKEWHDNGQLERDWIYINGKKEGEYIKLDRDGKVSYKAIYKNDKCISGDCN